MPSLDADMIQHAARRGRVIWTDAAENAVECTLICWRPHKTNQGGRRRTHNARIELDNGQKRTVSAGSISAVTT